MRGLPGSGKSTEVKKLLQKHAVSTDHVFSSDAYFSPVANALANLNVADLSLETAIAFAQRITEMWFRVSWSELKSRYLNDFLEFKELVDIGKYSEALIYAQSIHFILEMVEYRGKWNAGELHFAHQTTQADFFAAVSMGMSPVIVDNTNVAVRQAAPYAQAAHAAGYQVLIQEPTSDHWNKHRELFADTYKNRLFLAEFAVFLSEKNTHGVPLETLERMMRQWVHNMTVKELLEYKIN